ncbi:MAG: hypothetical protein HRU36_04450 [Rickettsiales bacterium]|nr:hypothetical protein [Rickettsiales bacterium]
MNIEKIAVFISGPYRFTDLVSKRLEKILTGFEFDFFYHIWNEDLGNKIREKRSFDIKKLRDNPKTKVIVTQKPYAEEDFKDSIGLKTGSHSTINATMGMFYSVSLLCSLINQLPDYNNYKYILRIRTDCIIINDDFMSKLTFDNKTITISNNYSVPFFWLSDHICFAEKNNFFKLWKHDSIESIYRSYKKGNRNPEQTLTYLYQKTSGLTVKKSLLRYKDYHIMYTTPRENEPACMNSMISNNPETLFDNPKQYIDGLEIDNYLNDLYKKRMINSKKYYWNKLSIWQKIKYKSKKGLCD